MLFFFGRPSRGRLGSLLPQYVAESLFSSDNLAGGGPAAAHFLWSPPKISKQRKATATTSPLRGSRRCGVTIGRAANSLRSNMRPSSPDAYPTPPATQKRFYKRLAAHCVVDVLPSLITLSTGNDRPRRQTAVLRQQRNAQRAVDSDPLRAGPVMCCGKWIRGAHV